MRGRSLALALALIGCASTEPIEHGGDAIDLAPREPASWSSASVLAALSAALPSARHYWYAPRALEIATTPDGAALELYYLRGNLQQRFEHASAPARVLIPARASADRRDVVLVRALLDGYREREARVAVQGDEDRVQLDLELLPNILERVAFRYFGGRGSLELVMRERPEFRANRSAQGVRIVLLETALPDSAPPVRVGSASPLVDAFEVLPVGKDLVVSVSLTARGRTDAGEPQLREFLDPVRGRHRIALDLAPVRSGAVSAEVARAAVARISRSRVTGCASDYERSLREALANAAAGVADAHADAVQRALVQAAIERLAQISPRGEIRMADGRVFHANRPIEVTAAAAEAPQVLGLIALLRAAVDELEAAPDRRAALQSLFAPDLPASEFAGALDRAQTRERACAASED